MAPRAEQARLSAQEQTSTRSGTLLGVGGEKLEMSSTARPRQQRQRWQPKGLSGALDHQMALQRAHSIRRAEHEPLDARQERGGRGQVASSEQQRRAPQ